MSLLPFLEAPGHIQIHAAAAVIALVLGPIAIYRQRRDRMHRVVGYIWVVAMALVALSAFSFHSFAVIGPFSPLHGFAVLTLWSLWMGIKQARAGDIAAHRTIFANLYWYGLMIAGLANFLPGRTSNAAAFGGEDAMGFVVIGVGAAVLIARLWVTRARSMRPAFSV